MSNFEHIVVVDFEYEVPNGGLPKVLCMVAYELNEHLEHMRTIKLWRGEFGIVPPFDTGTNTVFVAYSAWAEMTCFQVLGWKFPVYIFDQHTAYLAATNVLMPYAPDIARKKQKKGLQEACRAYGIVGWDMVDKESIAKDIGEGRWEMHGKEKCLAYCEEDVRVETELLRRQVMGDIIHPAADVLRVLHWSNYSAKSIAQIQAVGMPIDMRLWNLVQENKGAVITALLQQYDPSQGDEEPIYSSDGHLSYARFEQWLARNGVTDWPRLMSGQLKMKSDAFREMSWVPGVESIAALRDCLGVIVRAKLPIGSDGRNRPSLFPFGTATGRNAHRRSLFNAHAAMRSFMLFPEGKFGAYLDWRTQEVAVAAALSGDKQLIADYQAGDVYHALARVCGITDDPDPKRWKKEHPDVRDRMKKLQLAINYGMGVASLAKSLGSHKLVAGEIIDRHRRTYPRFWEWQGEMLDAAMVDRWIKSKGGWTLRLTSNPNKRTIYNFPMQSNGAEMLRMAVWRMCEAGIVPSMLVHDAILLEATSMDEVLRAKSIMAEAGRTICDGLEVGVDVEIHHGRYVDKRPVAKKMWGTIIGVLQKIRALPEETYHEGKSCFQPRQMG